MVMVRYIPVIEAVERLGKNRPHIGLQGKTDHVIQGNISGTAESRERVLQVFFLIDFFLLKLLQ